MSTSYGKKRPIWMKGLKFWLNIDRDFWSVDGTNEINSSLPVAYDLAQGLRVNFNGGSSTITLGNDRYYSFNDGYFMSVDTGYEKIPLDGECTVVMVLWLGDLTTRRTLLEKAGTTYASYEQELAMTWEVGETISYYSRQGDYDVASIPSLGTTGRKMAGIKMTSGKVAGVARTGYYSINGAAWTQSYTSRSTNAIVPAGRLTIGTGYAGAVGASNAALLGISQVMIWDKQLSDAEISALYTDMQEQHPDSGL